MNGIAKQFLGLAGGAAALALVAGISPASATLNTFTLNPSGAGFTPSANPAYAPFITAGGDAIGFFGLTLPTAVSGAYSFQAGVEINQFGNSTLTGVLGQSVTGLNFDNLQGWQFFITIGITGTGTWTSGTPLTDPSQFDAGTATVALDLWAAKGGNGAEQFKIPTKTDSTPAGDGDTTKLADFGLTGCTNPSDCKLVGTGTGIAGASSFRMNDPQEDTVTFTIGADLTLTDSILFSGLTNTQLFIRSGCQEGTALPIGIAHGDENDNKNNSKPDFFSQSNGGGCQPSDNSDATHDKITWDLGDPARVPEPASLAILGSALLGFGLIRRRRNS